MDRIEVDGYVLTTGGTALGCGFGLTKDAIWEPLGR